MECDKGIFGLFNQTFKSKLTLQVELAILIIDMVKCDFLFFDFQVFRSDTQSRLKEKWVFVIRIRLVFIYRSEYVSFWTLVLTLTDIVLVDFAIFFFIWNLKSLSEHKPAICLEFIFLITFDLWYLSLRILDLLQYIITLHFCIYDFLIQFKKMKY